MCRNACCRSTSVSVGHAKPPVYPPAPCRSSERRSASRIQAETLGEKGGVKLCVHPVGAETKDRIAVHVQEALQAVDRAPCVRSLRVQPLRKGRNRQAAVRLVESIERVADGLVVRRAFGPWSAAVAAAAKRARRLRNPEGSTELRSEYASAFRLASRVSERRSQTLRRSCHSDRSTTREAVAHSRPRSGSTPEPPSKGSRRAAACMRAGSPSPDPASNRTSHTRPMGSSSFACPAAFPGAATAVSQTGREHRGRDRRR